MKILILINAQKASALSGFGEIFDMRLAQSFPELPRICLE